MIGGTFKRKFPWRINQFPLDVYQSLMELEFDVCQITTDIDHGNLSKSRKHNFPPLFSAWRWGCWAYFLGVRYRSIQFSLKILGSNSHPNSSASAFPFPTLKSRKYEFPDGEKFEARTRSTNLSQELGQAEPTELGCATSSWQFQLAFPCFQAM